MNYIEFILKKNMSQHDRLVLLVKKNKYLGKDFILKSVFVNNRYKTFVNLVFIIAKSWKKKCRLDEKSSIVNISRVNT